MSTSADENDPCFGWVCFFSVSFGVSRGTCLSFGCCDSMFEILDVMELSSLMISFIASLILSSSACIFWLFISSISSIFFVSSAFWGAVSSLSCS